MYVNCAHLHHVTQYLPRHHCFQVDPRCMNLITAAQAVARDIHWWWLAWAPTYPGEGRTAFPVRLGGNLTGQLPKKVRQSVAGDATALQLLSGFSLVVLCPDLFFLGRGTKD